MATAQSRVTDMTRGDPVRLLLNFSAPLFLSNLLQQFYNLADTALAGHILGDAALAEIGATAAVLTVVFVGVRRPLLVLLQVPEASIDGALAYLTLILLGIPLTMAYLIIWKPPCCGPLATA